MGEKWQPIETAPKDGSRVWVKRIYKRRIVKEGWARWSMPHEDSPMRQPLEPDPLGRPEPAWITEKPEVVGRWLNQDRMHAFPSPTHWLPDPPK